MLCLALMYSNVELETNLLALMVLALVRLPNGLELIETLLECAVETAIDGKDSSATPTVH